MSVRVIDQVFRHYPSGGSELLVMLAMADWSDDAGGSLHPSMRSIAAKARLSEKQARRIVRQLEQAGWLIVIGNAAGGHPGASKRYRMDTSRLVPDALSNAATPPMGGRAPVDGRAPAGVPNPTHGREGTPPMGGRQTVIEPSVTVNGRDARDECGQIVDCWNALADQLGRGHCRKLTDKRRSALRARLREYGAEAIREAIGAIPASPFLRGDAGSWSGATFDFLMRPDTVTKIIEGAYRDRPKRASAQTDGFRAAIHRAASESPPADQPMRHARTPQRDGPAAILPFPMTRP